MAGPMSLREQLSLYVPPPIAQVLEEVRRVVDPVQAGLIPAHVTLCREDEISGLTHAELAGRLRAAGPLALRFGGPVPFHEHGLLMPCVGGEEEFQGLRRLVLGSTAVRRHAPHLTLAHPRNPKAQGNSLANAAPLAGGVEVTFTSVRWIRQEGSAPWEVRCEYELSAAGTAAGASHER